MLSLYSAAFNGFIFQVPVQLLSGHVNFNVNIFFVSSGVLVLLFLFMEKGSLKRSATAHLHACGDHLILYARSHHMQIPFNNLQFWYQETQWTITPYSSSPSATCGFMDFYHFLSTICLSVYLVILIQVLHAIHHSCHPPLKLFPVLLHWAWDGRNQSYTPYSRCTYTSNALFFFSICLLVIPNIWIKFLTPIKMTPLKNNEKPYFEVIAISW